MARRRGGRRPATSEEAIINALRQILIEIQSVNAVFASASLPINATNRSQNENQVFIGMFRPDADANPRYGNLKRYQIGLFGAEAKLPTGTATRQCRPRPASSSLRDQLLDDRQRQLELLAGERGSVLAGAHYSVLLRRARRRTSKGATAEVVRKKQSACDRRDADQRRGAHDLPCSSVSTCKFSQPLDQFDSSVVRAAIGAADVIEHKRLIDFVLGVDVADHNVNNDYLDVRPSVHGDVAHVRCRSTTAAPGGRLLRDERRRAARGARRRRKGAVGLRARARRAEADARPDPARDVSEHGGAFSDSNACARTTSSTARRAFPERRQQQSLDVPVHAARRPHALQL